MLANGVEPPTHVVGIVAGSLAYAVQSGTGVAVPTQVICCTALGRPVLSSADPTRLVPGIFWKRPTPPRTTALGPRTAPRNDAICGALPYDHENPTRGLT